MSLLPLYKKINKDISVGEDLKKKRLWFEALGFKFGETEAQGGKGTCHGHPVVNGPWSPDYQPGVYFYTSDASYSG